MNTLSSGIKHYLRDLLNDEFHIARQFLNSFGRPVNLLKPTTFNEKIQVQKLYNRDPRMTKLADKYQVREYIKRSGHGDILNDLIGVYDYPEEIDFDTLPDRFVIKCNHSWATNIICDDKQSLDKAETVKKLRTWQKENHYLKLREWAYRDIKPKILIEKHLGHVLKDYKFFCFSGKPLYVQVDSERFGQHTLDLFDTEWNSLDCEKGNKNQSKAKEPAPKFLGRMLTIAKDISSDFNFCRVDFMATEETFYFGEITFYPGGGYSRFKPDDYDYIFSRPFKTEHLSIPLSSRIKIVIVNFLAQINLL